MNLSQIKTWATGHKTELAAGGAVAVAGAALWARRNSSTSDPTSSGSGLALSGFTSGSDTNTGADYSGDYLDAINNVAGSLGQQIADLTSAESSQGAALASLQSTTASQGTTLTGLKSAVAGLTKPPAAKPAPAPAKKKPTPPKPSPKPAPPPKKTTTKTYTVKAGDTLSAIAKKLHVPLATLEQTNAAAIKKQGSNNLIHPGLKLKY